MIDPQKPPKITYGVPTTGTFSYLFANNLFRWVNKARGNLIFQHGLLPFVRDSITKAFLEHGSDFLVMQDDDLVVEGETALDGMVSLLQDDPTIGIVGAVYLKAQPRITTVSIAHPEYRDWRIEIVDGRPVDVAPELCTVVRRIPSIPFQCDGVGTGFCVIRKECVEQMIEKWGIPLWRMPVLRSRFGLNQPCTDDTDFCLRTARLGWKVIADPRPVTFHLKSIGHLCYIHDEWEKVQNIDMRPLREGSCEPIVIGGIECLDMTLPYRKRLEAA
jgi:hypothetical protein